MNSFIKGLIFMFQLIGAVLFVYGALEKCEVWQSNLFAVMVGIGLAVIPRSMYKSLVEMTN